MRKKGFMYTFFIILLIGLLTLSFQLQNRSNTVLDQATLLTARMESTNDLLDDVLLDFNRVVGVSAVHAFLSAIEIARRTETYLDDVNLRIPELMRNGTEGGVEINGSRDTSLAVWGEAVSNISGEFGVNISLSPAAITLSEEGPWIVNITATVNITLQDTLSDSLWNFTYVSTYLMNISQHNLTDPTFIIEGRRNYNLNTGTPTSQDLPSVFSQNPYTSWWWNDTSQFYPLNVNVSDLRAHMQTFRYRNDTDAPSFLMRFEGNFSASPNGIESFVDVLASPWSTDYAVSPIYCLTDFQFLVSGCTTQHRITNMPPNFYIDDAHLVSYNLTKINST
ncbi:MAG: hypothetical protein Q7S65_06450 [Nanoarchaeota archaeon]|nr:hypothetical protein [Nanoarchaeota archaeon]